MAELVLVREDELVRKMWSRTKMVHLEPIAFVIAAESERGVRVGPSFLLHMHFWQRRRRTACQHSTPTRVFHVTSLMMGEARAKRKKNLHSRITPRLKPKSKRGATQSNVLSTLNRAANDYETSFLSPNNS